MDTMDSPDLNDQESDVERIELEEWLYSMEYVISQGDPKRVYRLLQALESLAARAGITSPYSTNTPYLNTISPDDQDSFPGDRTIERKIKGINRWNALAMVARANRDDSHNVG